MGKKVKGKKGGDGGRGGAATPSLRDCANCGAAEGSIAGTPVHNACARCLCTFYCSVKCQKQHWKQGGHKQHCVPSADRKVPEEAKKKAPSKKEGGTAAAAAAATEEEEEEEEESEEPECAICLEPLSGSTASKLPCSHIFHDACVEKIRTFGVKQVCPMCRADLPRGGAERLWDEAVRRLMILDRRYEQGSDRPWRPVAAKDKPELEQAVGMLRESAEKGYAHAQFDLGLMHTYGQGVPLNYALARKWYQKSAVQGRADAQYNLGCIYKQGKGVPQNYTLAVKWHQMAANQGHSFAAQSMGLMYHEGQGGLRRDDSMSVKWHLWAASQGLSEAYVSLGFMSAQGHGVPQDYAKAHEWWRKAQIQMDPRGDFNIAIAYTQGKGVPVDLATALKLFRKAAAQGYTEAVQYVALTAQALHHQQTSGETPRLSASRP